MSLRKIYYNLSPNLRFVARKIYYFPIDLYEGLTGKREKYEPKKGDIYIGSGDFIKQGKHQLDLLKRYVNLQASDAVLDIGSGIGRTAIPLTGYLGSSGRYEGFDVVEKGVNWCNAKIKKDFPNFNFIYVPLNNDLYNNSSEQASDFRFPYENNTFDVTFLFSVFTHMGIDEIDHYLSEISRVLKPGGKCLATFFLYDEQNEEKIAEIKNFNFPVRYEGYRLMDDAVKSANIAVDKKRLAEMLKKSNLKSTDIVEGFWKGMEYKTAENTYQDLVILEKK